MSNTSETDLDFQVSRVFSNSGSGIELDRVQNANYFSDGFVAGHFDAH